VPVAGFRFPIEMMEDEQVLANRMLHDVEHPLLGTVRVLASPVTLDGDGFQPGPATPPFGSEARAILASLGFSADEVQRLVADGVTRESFSGPAPATAAEPS
jgi:formyl-CoA transferase